MNAIEERSENDLLSFRHTTARFDFLAWGNENSVSHVRQHSAVRGRTPASRCFYRSAILWHARPQGLDGGMCDNTIHGTRPNYAALVACRHASAHPRRLDDDRSGPGRLEVTPWKVWAWGGTCSPCATTDQSKERSRPLPRSLRRF